VISEHTHFRWLARYQPSYQRTSIQTELFLTVDIFLETVCNQVIYEN